MTRRSQMALVILGAVILLGLGFVWFQQQPDHHRPANALQALLEDLENVAPEVRARAENNLRQRNQDILPVLVGFLAGTNAVPTSADGESRARVEASFSRERLRRQAIRAFEVLGEKGRLMIPELIRMMEQTNQIYAAARALAGIGAVEELRAFQKNERTEVRTAVASALGHVSSKEQDAILGLLASVTDAEPAVRAAAMGSLGQQRKVPGRAVPVLTEGLKDKHSTVRLAAAKSLGKYGGQAESALSGLEAARQDSDRQVRRAARQAIELINLEKP